MIRVIIFDVDGVLLDSKERNFRFFQDLFREAGYKVPTEEEYKKLLHLGYRDTVRELAGGISKEEVNKICNYADVVPRRDDLMGVPEGIHETLSVLNKKYLLGIATSRIRESMEKYLGKYDLLKYFKESVTYYETKKHKPDPEPLLVVTKRLGVTPEESVYVGDTDSDIMASRSAGMKVILYSHESIDGADYQTSDFKEIPKLIEKL